jgi:hypothetical protein
MPVAAGGQGGGDREGWEVKNCLVSNTVVGDESSATGGVDAHHGETLTIIHNPAAARLRPNLSSACRSCTNRILIKLNVGSSISK